MTNVSPRRGWGWWVYFIALVVAVVTPLGLRHESLLAGNVSPLDLILALVGCVLLLSPLFREVSLGGVTVKRELERTREELSARIGELHTAISSSVTASQVVNVQPIVQREVAKAQFEAIRTMAEVDRELLPNWELERSTVAHTRPDMARKKMRLLEERFDDLAGRFRSAPLEEKVQYAWALRPLYWEWLAAARKFYGSTGGYQEIRGRIEKQMEELAQLGLSEADAGQGTGQ